jgi:hypothetical protein
MASEGPPRAEAILCVRVPCRAGRERVWQAIELLRQEQRQPQQAHRLGSRASTQDAPQAPFGQSLRL